MDNQIENELDNIKNLPNEQWRDIPEYESRYQVSSHGRVKRKEYVIEVTNKYGNTHIRILQEKLLTPCKGNQSGHLMLTLIDEDGNRNQHYTHRLVLKAFRGKPVVVHLDNDPSNNHISNLRYRSQKENIRQSVNQGRHSGLQTSVDHVTNEFQRMLEQDESNEADNKEDEVINKMINEFFSELQENGIGVGLDE